MSEYSVFRVRFSRTNPSGAVVAGPYTTNVGVSGGSRADAHNPTLTAALVTAIDSNILGILQGQGFGGAAGPGGVTTIHSYDHAGAPDVWV